jgi:hypothetical protein
LVDGRVKDGVALRRGGVALHITLELIQQLDKQRPKLGAATCCALESGLLRCICSLHYLTEPAALLLAHADAGDGLPFGGGANVGSA